MAPCVLLLLALLVGPSTAEGADRAPTVTGPVFDAYLDVRIDLRREEPALDARVEDLDDPAPMRRALTPFVERQGLTFEQFSQAHRLVSRDPGLKGRVAAILDRHSPASGAGPLNPPGGAVRPPPGSDRR